MGYFAVSLSLRSAFRKKVVWPRVYSEVYSLDSFSVLISITLLEHTVHVYVVLLLLTNKKHIMVERGNGHVLLDLCLVRRVTQFVRARTICIAGQWIVTIRDFARTKRPHFKICTWNIMNMPGNCENNDDNYWHQIIYWKIYCEFMHFYRIIQYSNNFKQKYFYTVLPTSTLNMCILPIK